MTFDKLASANERIEELKRENRMLREQIAIATGALEQIDDTVNYDLDKIRPLPMQDKFRKMCDRVGDCYEALRDTIQDRKF